MNNLVVRPSRSLFKAPFDDLFDTFFDGFFNRPTKQLVEKVGLSAAYPRFDIIETDKEYIVKASVCGAKDEDVKVEVEKDVVTITVKTEDEYKDNLYHVRELKKSIASRAVQLPEYVQDKEQPTAVLDKGILTLTWKINKQETPKVSRKQIAVKSLSK